LGLKEAGLEKETEERKWLMSIHSANRTHKRGITYFERVNKVSQKCSKVKIFGKESEDKKIVPLLAKKAHRRCGGLAPFTRQ
jgi:hypothetical protein